MSHDIPLIDIAKCGLGIKEDKDVIDQDLRDIGDKVYAALSTSGFAYLSNHGIPWSKVEGLHDIAEAFYSAPEDEKKLLYGHKVYFGYDPIGATKADTKHIDYQEGFRISGEAYTDENIKWPKTPKFKETCFDFATTAASLLMRLLKALAYGMKLKDKEYFCNAHSLINKKGNVTQLKMVKYPPALDDEVLAEHKMRLGEHCDFTTMILLFQDSVGGLQVEDKTGQFVDVTPIPGTIVLNVGQTLEAWSGKRLKATKHRVRPTRDPEKRGLVRRSVVYFGQANDDELLKQLEFEDGQDDHTDEPMLEPMTAAQFVAKRFEEVFY